MFLNRTSVTYFEADGSASGCVILEGGRLDRNVIVNLVTLDGTAIGTHNNSY